MRKFICILVLSAFFISFKGQAQTTDSYLDTMNLTEFWTTILEGDGDSLVELAHIFVTTNDRKEYYEINKYQRKPRTIEHSIEIRDIYFQGYYSEYSNEYHSFQTFFDSITFKKSVYIDIINSKGLTILNCIFEDWVLLNTDGFEGIRILNSSFLNGVDLSSRRNEANEKFNGKITIGNTSIIQKRSLTKIHVDGKLYLNNCHFLPKNNTDSSDSIWLSIGGEISNLSFKSDTFIIPVIFAYNTKVTNTVHVSNCYFNLFSIENLTLPENQFNTYLKWNQIKDRLAFPIEFYTKITSGGEWRGDIKIRTSYNTFSTDSSFINEFYFDKLISHANQLLAIYKTQGDIQSSNQCYADIKKFETKRWKYLYKKDKSFINLFKWQLNKFLSYFTDYGTNPAKAVIKSAWVILLFSIFYLFFPSDWDVSSRSQLLSRAKDLFRKNREKAIPWTLGFVIYSAFINLLNAITLSLNAFTTLGFGDIPTHGAARYVTIIQGFIGWFLLTIFSVSLISQVLS